MYAKCPACEKKVNMEINEIINVDNYFSLDRANVRAYVTCPECKSHLIGSILYTSPELKHLEPDFYEEYYTPDEDKIYLEFYKYLDDSFTPSDIYDMSEEEKQNIFNNYIKKHSAN